MEFTLIGRGNTYRLNDKGEFYDPEYGFSTTWKVYGVARVWNGQPVLWKHLREILKHKDQIVVGYLHDLDHGTHRVWGGCYLGKLPKVKIYRSK